jgi:adenine/guanine phosphoribosyltransferase-like PRPP-binding protein
MHEWLANQLAAGSTISMRANSGTKYLSFENVHREADRIHELIPPADGMEADEIMILDLSATPYSLLRDPLLLQLASAAEQRAEDSARTIIILMRSVPAENSPFWEPFRRERLNGSGAAILVIDSRGDIRPFGARRTVPSDFGDAYSTRQADLQGSDLDHFHEKLLRRLGHFDLQITGRRDATCGRYFYDASLCVEELANIIGHRLHKNVDMTKLSDSATLVVAAGPTQWMEDACRVVADRAGLAFCVLPAELPTDPPATLSEDDNILAFGVVNTGATLRSVLRAFKDWQRPIARWAIAALSAQPTLSGISQAIELDIIGKVDFETWPRAKCPQCALGIPKSGFATDEERYLQLTAYDFWSMALRATWGPEEYAGEGSARFDYDPDFSEVFDEFGDWIALRYELLLEHLGFTNEVVVVCPEEQAIMGLVARLRARLEGRLVTVAIPRAVLDRSTDYQVERVSRSHDAATATNSEDEWERQLRHINRSAVSVAIIDEFSASGKTRADILRILQAHRVSIAGHLPFVDRAPAQLFDRLETIPLYQLTSPRQ